MSARTCMCCDNVLTPSAVYQHYGVCIVCRSLWARTDAELIELRKQDWPTTKNQDFTEAVARQKMAIYKAALDSPWTKADPVWDGMPPMGHALMSPFSSCVWHAETEQPKKKKPRRGERRGTGKGTCQQEL